MDPGTIINNDGPYVDCPSPIVNDADPGICADTIVIPGVILDYWPEAQLEWTMTGQHTDFGTDQIGNYVFEVGMTEVTYYVDDEISDNSASCTFTVTVEDNEDPVAVCQGAAVILDASGYGSVTVADIENGSYDNCGILEMSLDTSEFDCDDLGENTIVLTVLDVHRNSSTCEAVVTVDPGTGLPSSWSNNDVGSGILPGWAEFNPCTGEEFTLGSHGYSSHAYSDVGHFVYQELCCDVTVIAKVRSIEEIPFYLPGKAGVMIRETLDQTSKMVSLSTDLGYWVYRKARTYTYSTAYSYRVYKPFG